MCIRIAIHSWLYVLALVSLARSQPSDAFRADTLVLCPRDFQYALRDWLSYREAQGHRFVVESPARSAYEVQRQIRRVAELHPLTTVLLVGDAVADRGQGHDNTIPTDYRIAKVNSQFGSEPEIATDFSYADLDGDSQQDLHMGRIPADSAEDLAEYLHKVINYERSRDFGPWRRRIELVAGVGNFNPLVDGVIEQTARRIISDLVPSWYEINVTVANWRSPYCPDPRQIDSVIVEQINEGCLFWVYLGHGTPDALAPLDAGQRRFTVFDQRHARQIRCARGNPIGFFFSCYTGAFDARRDCLAETLLRNPEGPVACVCGTRMTMPYGLATFSHEFLSATGDGQPQATLGAMLTVSKRRLCTPVELTDDIAEGDYREMIESLAQTFSPTSELLELERFEHAQMIHLLGDPLLRVAQPQRLEFELSAEQAQPGAAVQVTGIAEAEGTLILELCYDRDRLRIRPPHRKQLVLDEAAMRDFAATYEGSNNAVCSRTQIPVKAGVFSAELVIPADANGNCHVRAFLETQQHSWAQAAPLLLK